MELINSIWGVLLFLGLVGLPQFLGVLAYVRLRKYQDFAAHLLSSLIPPVLFFYFTQMIFASAAREIQSQGERVCGAFAGVAVITILFGTVVQLFFGIVVQMMLHFRHRSNSAN